MRSTRENTRKKVAKRNEMEKYFVYIHKGPRIRDLDKWKVLLLKTENSSRVIERDTRVLYTCE